MKMKKLVTMFLVATMVMTSLWGCGKPTTDENVTPSPQESQKSEEKSSEVQTTPAETSPTEEIVNLKWIAVGSGMPQNYDAWKENINKYLGEKIGVNIDMEVVAWGDWPNRRNVIVNSGEQFDILFTDMDRYQSEVDLGAFMDITDLLPVNAANIYEMIPEVYWQATSIDGKLYSIPTYKDNSITNYWVWDKAILDKYEINPEEHVTFEEMTEPLKKIADGEGKPSLPLHKNGVYGMATSLFDNMGTGIHVFGVRYDGKDATVVNGLEDEEFLKYMDITREWYKAGIINADAATTDEVDEYKICSINQGWSGAAKTSWGPNHDMEAVAIQMFPTALSNSTVRGSLNAISASCKNPEKALQFLDLVNTDTFVRDSFYFGLEGDDFEYTADKKIHRLKTDWSMAGYTQGTFFTVSQLDTEEFNQWDEVKELNNNAIASPALGINFDTIDVETELANVRAVWEKYKGEFMTGTKEPREMAKMITKEMNNAGLQTLIEEAQKQVNEQLSK